MIENLIWPIIDIPYTSKTVLINFISKTEDGPRPGEISFTMKNTTFNRDQEPEFLEKILATKKINEVETTEKNLPFTLEKSCNNIAKKTKRGKGNIIFYNPENALPKFLSDKICVPFRALKKDEYLVCYIGFNNFDSPIVRTSQHKLIKHPEYVNYFERIIVNGK